ncbi:hypothetical protein UAW_02676 [Enterococcus haemoperoxidus ATCC BAA-382]|uniref:Integral membrane protein n=1 Tax=Enterococcus haemoperoxidus ATCC BAA-382 TaxID=1158608 RepID=R2QAK6_9ENTE|nr:DUF2798 domain-containing protein [Enterococcus haemoperoxidus]EOH93427.1 hypothetical protein UAW_02676 [Enterococcus haemoperoxidus ATCC BAA-382]EOT61381.1 hypothetical protein I583_00360 [Enterococcus haemoperoxidus ATCC BAA-382]OJG51678.1 hypothetical protein RV06_GL001583 [Enterococcus haemoperoxidus]
MPQNKKEGIFFTTIVCFSMVISMSAYNLLLHGQFSLSNLFGGLVPGFIVAFIFDVLVVSSPAKKIAFSLPVNKEKKIQLIIAVSSCMVLGMVFFMSMYGVFMQFGFTENFLRYYVDAFAKNLIMALPLQLLLVGPLCRMILSMSRQSNWLKETND